MVWRDLDSRHILEREASHLHRICRLFFWWDNTGCESCYPMLYTVPLRLYTNTLQWPGNWASLQRRLAVSSLLTEVAASLVWSGKVDGVHAPPIVMGSAQPSHLHICSSAPLVCSMRCMAFRSEYERIHMSAQSSLLPPLLLGSLSHSRQNTADIRCASLMYVWAVMCWPWCCLWKCECSSPFEIQFKARNLVRKVFEAHAQVQQLPVF